MGALSNILTYSNHFHSLSTCDAEHPNAWIIYVDIVQSFWNVSADDIVSLISKKLASRTHNVLL
jgi:hypothetical protein